MNCCLVHDAAIPESAGMPEQEAKTMTRYLLSRLIDHFERFLGVELPYLREIVTSAPGAMLPIGLFMPASSYGRHIPSDVLHMVRLGATKAQDCGECLQISVNIASRDGVSSSVLRAAVHGRIEHLSAALADAFLFGQGVGSGLEVTPEREALRSRFGERGVIEASMAAATALLFPALKRGMGFAQTCDLEALTIGHSAESGIRVG